MFGKKKRAPQPKGQGAAAAKQMGLFVDLNPEEMMMGMDGNLDDPDLEAELAAITGKKAAAGGKARQKGKSPLPMEDIARMADECMKDLDDDDDDNVEDDEDLLAELQEVVGEEEAEDVSSTSSAPAESSKGETPESPAAQVQYTLLLPNPSQSRESEATSPQSPAAPDVITPSSEEEQSSSAALSTLSSLPSPQEQTDEEAADVSQSDANKATKKMLLERQQEYKMAALRAKKQGDVEQAKLYFKTSKSFDAAIEALEKGQSVDLSGLPSPPGQGGSSAPVAAAPAGQSTQPTQPAAAAPAPSAPKDVLEALEQRRAKYMEASAQAKASGDDRKARMHDRIAKQYQSAIRAHKAGKAVNFDELPVPPGFPPIPGQKAVGAEEGIVAALEAANKLASSDAAEVADEEEDEAKEELAKPAAPEEPKKPTLDIPTAGHEQKRTPSASPDRTTIGEGLSQAAVQQLEFLEGRKKQYMKAALQAKQKNDMEQAKIFLRTAKGFEPMIEAARSGKTVDISTVPSPPGDEDEDFILVHHSDVQISEKAEEVYTQLAKILKEQHEKCLTYSEQFKHLGNVTETTKFEKMAESCKKSMEVLKLAQSRGLPPPKHHFEEKSFRIAKIFPELSSTDMVVIIVKGMNLPAPSGIQANDLDAYVKFEFPYPSAEQPQKLKTAVIKNTNSPEYNQSFKLQINRNHRGFRRVVTAKGLKLELLHKGGFLRSDKPIGTALLKLDKLESHSEIREIVEVMDGRKPTGGRIEVKVRLREPLSGQDMQTSTERWLVIDQSQVLV
ncbi:coiled-coil and C2 domain-containing protein 1B [Neolamprologus brichardi]|nr:coiled-coil and C2 domain-containing protein 1B [Neolamprologus brichardi]